jgi:FeS assembly SUF system protein
MDNSKKIDEIKDKLKTIFDPEIPVDIYELGLIYDVRLKDKSCEIDMTLTSPNCPEAQSIPNNVRKAVESLGHYDEVVVRIVWDPPWDKSKMSEVAKLALNV